MPLYTAKGLLSPAALLLHTDALAQVLKTTAPSLGRNAPNESGTGAALAHLARLTTLGNGSSTYPGLSVPDFKANVRADFDALVGLLSWDKLFAKVKRPLSELDSLVTNGIPSSWSFVDSTNQKHPFDLYLSRLNGAASAPVAGTPTAGTLTAANSASGRMAECSSGQRPYLVHTLVGDKSWKETLPSGNATQVTIAAPNNSYTYQIAGTVPAGVSYVRLYRGYYGDASGDPKYWFKDYAVTAGSSYPAIPILENDSELRTDIRPPSWLQCLMTPEFAAWYALTFATAPPTGDGPMQYAAGGMLAAENVLLGPLVRSSVNQILGLGNVSQHGLYGTHVIGTGWTQGSILTANNASGSVQGFAGAYGTGSSGLQGRVTSALNAAGTVDISYEYYSSANGWGSAQTDTLTSDAFSGTGVGQTANFDIPAGRIVREVEVTGVTGMASGTFQIEATNRLG